MSEAIELVVFSAKPGVKDTGFKAAALWVTPILEKCRDTSPASLVPRATDSTSISCAGKTLLRLRLLCNK